MHYFMKERIYYTYARAQRRKHPVIALLSIQMMLTNMNKNAAEDQW